MVNLSIDYMVLLFVHIYDVYPKGYTTLKEAREGIGEYIKLYNKQRLHSALDYKTPDEVYFGKVNTTDFICQNWLEDVA